MGKPHDEHHFKIRRNRTGQRKYRGTDSRDEQNWFSAIAVGKRTVDQRTDASPRQKRRNDILNLVWSVRPSPRTWRKGGQHGVNGKRH